MSSSRRSFIAHAAGLGAAAAIADWTLVDEAIAHAARAVAAQPRPAFTTLTAAEGRAVEAMTARIVPTTETPGAREAGAVYFIDKALGSFEKDALGDVRKAVADVNQRAARKKRGATYDALPAADQDAILKDIQDSASFRTVLFLTMVGTYGNPAYGGNRNAVGWKLLGFKMQPKYQPPFGYYDAPAQLRRGGAR